MSPSSRHRRRSHREVVGAAAVLVSLTACGSPPAIERVSPIVMTEHDTPTGPGTGARPVELPDPAPAGDRNRDG